MTGAVPPASEFAGAGGLGRVLAVKGVLAGMLGWLAISGLLGSLARATWPAYAAAVSQRRYTLAMLGLRLAAGLVATVGAGALASRIAGRRPRAALWLGLVLLAASAVRHVQIWPQYPIWYHVVYLAYLAPGAAAGGRLIRAA